MTVAKVVTENRMMIELKDKVLNDERGRFLTSADVVTPHLILHGETSSLLLYPSGIL
jgi:hypothetical protein